MRTVTSCLGADHSRLSDQNFSNELQKQPLGGPTDFEGIFDPSHREPDDRSYDRSSGLWTDSLIVGCQIDVLTHWVAMSCFVVCSPPNLGRPRMPHYKFGMCADACVCPDSGDDQIMHLANWQARFTMHSKMLHITCTHICKRFVLCDESACMHVIRSLVGRCTIGRS